MLNDFQWQNAEQEIAINERWAQHRNSQQRASSHFLPTVEDAHKGDTSAKCFWSTPRRIQQVVVSQWNKLLTLPLLTMVRFHFRASRNSAQFLPWLTWLGSLCVFYFIGCFHSCLISAVSGDEFISWAVLMTWTLSSSCSSRESGFLAAMAMPGGRPWAFSSLILHCAKSYRPFELFVNENYKL